MVSGRVIRSMLSAVRKKKGVEGLKRVIAEINRETVLFTDEEEVKPRADYPYEMAEKVLKAVEDMLGEETLAEHLFQTTTRPIMPFKKGNLKRAVEKTVEHAHRQFPMFRYSIEPLTEHAFRIKVRGSGTARIYLQKKMRESFPDAIISVKNGTITIRIETD